MLQRKTGEAGLRRADVSTDGRKVSAMRDSDSVSPYRKDTTASEYDKKSLASAMGTSLAGFLTAKRFARKVTSRLGGGSWGKQSRVSNVESRFPKEPTYRMEPEKKFCPGTVQAIIKSILTERLEGFIYAPQQAAILSQILTDEIKEKVKGLGLDRYRLVCQVTIGEKRGQSVVVTSRCIWDHTLDNSATYTYDTPTMYCSATVFGVYNE